MMAPRTLFGRTTLVIALVSFAFQLFTIGVITYFALVPLGRQATDDFAALMIDTAQAWQARRPPGGTRCRSASGRLHRIGAGSARRGERFHSFVPYFHLLEGP